MDLVTTIVVTSLIASVISFIESEITSINLEEATHDAFSSVTLFVMKIITMNMKKTHYICLVYFKKMTIIHCWL